MNTFKNSLSSAAAFLLVHLGVDVLDSMSNVGVLEGSMLRSGWFSSFSANIGRKEENHAV